jgi:ADP-L-glycero-D-manno-heptose 6-epimerase
MIVVTGAAGFIGSCLVSRLNQAGKENIVVVDDFTKHEKDQNLVGKKLAEKVERNVFESWLQKNGKEVEIIFHIGARTDTTEFDKSIFDELNVSYSKDVWNACVRFNIPFVYASSAATYGLGEFGYSDDHANVMNLKPLNPYGYSKNDFDKWVLEQDKTPPFWAGLKFFNVYGPNEYHKGRMASVIFHTFRNISASGEMKLFRSHNPKFTDGGQLRDFVYVKDSVQAMLEAESHWNGESALTLNIASGVETSVNSLLNMLAECMEAKPTKIEFMPTRDGDVLRHCGDSSKYTALTGKKISEISIDSLRETIEWYTSNVR